MSANLKVLNELTNSKKKIDNIQDSFQSSEFYYPDNLHEIWNEIININTIFEELKEEWVYKASLIVNIDFDNLDRHNMELYDIGSKTLVKEDNPDLSSWLKDGEKIVSLIQWVNIWHDKREDKIYIKIQKPNGDIDDRGIKLREIYKENVTLFNQKKEEVMKKIEDWIKCYDNMEYKRKEDFIEVYKKVYGK